MPDNARPALAAISSPSIIPAHPSYVVELGGQCVSQFGSLTAALSAGLVLKRQNAGVQVKVYDARERETA